LALPGEPVLPDAALNLVGPAAPVEGVVVSNERCTASSKAAAFVRHIAIDVSGTPLAGRFLAGQSFGVLPPGVDAKGRPHQLRLYSIASPSAGEDGEGRVLATTVKRTIEELKETHRLYLGVASNYLCDLHPGDRVRVTGPSGKRFLLPADPDGHDYIFFATGTGIAPFRAMVMELLARRAKSRVVLVMGAPYATDLLYHTQFLDLQSRHENFRYLPALSRERQADGSAPMYVHDHLSRTADLLQPLLASPRTLVYVCGILGMELSLLQQMAQVLPADVRDQYLSADAEVLRDIPAWTHKMLHRQVKHTRRFLLEVY
jgi:ferredoxin--NADP+ reductase